MLGDSVVLTVLGQVAFMPVLVLAARLCPEVGGFLPPPKPCAPARHRRPDVLRRAPPCRPFLFRPERSCTPCVAPSAQGPLDEQHVPCGGPQAPQMPSQNRALPQPSITKRSGPPQQRWGQAALASQLMKTRS